MTTAYFSKKKIKQTDVANQEANTNTGFTLHMNIFSIENSFDKPIGVLTGGVDSEGSDAQNAILKMINNLDKADAFE